MNKPRNWENTQAYTGELEKLPPGAYECRIMGVGIRTTFGEQLMLQLEIEAGQYKGYAKRVYDNRRSKGNINYDVKWPIIATQFVSDRNGDASPFFKGVITAIEESNPGYKFDFDENTLKGKLIGYIFREEEFIDQEGKLRVTVRPYQARSIDGIRKHTGDIPRKTIDGKQNGASYAQDTVGSTNGFDPADDEPLPF